MEFVLGTAVVSGIYGLYSYVHSDGTEVEKNDDLVKEIPMFDRSKLKKVDRSSIEKQEDELTIILRERFKKIRGEE